MTIHLEEGKFYRTRSGEKVGPIERTFYSDGSGNSSWPFTIALERFWNDKGEAWNTGTRSGGGLTNPNDDLVAEWPDEPAPLVIEEGKAYRTRDGRKVGPMSKAGSGADAYAFYGHVACDVRGTEFDRVFQADGKHGSAGHGGVVENIAELDIVAEWTAADEPAVSIPELMQDLAVIEKPDVKAEIADEAKRIVTGARRSAYGTPENNFGRIARLWNSHLVNVGILDANVMGDPEAKGGITPGDVSLMMALMKVARLAETSDHRDSYVDLVGYALTAAEVNGVQPLTPDKPQA